MSSWRYFYIQSIIFLTNLSLSLKNSNNYHLQITEAEFYETLHIFLYRFIFQVTSLHLNFLPCWFFYFPILNLLAVFIAHLQDNCAAGTENKDIKRKIFFINDNLRHNSTLQRIDNV